MVSLAPDDLEAFLKESILLLERSNTTPDQKFVRVGSGQHKALPQRADSGSGAVGSPVVHPYQPYASGDHRQGD